MAEGAAMEVEEYADVDVNDPLLLKSRKRKLKNAPGSAAQKRKRSNESSPAAPAAAAPQYEPRSYQSEVLDKALVQNTIVFLETGSGKTYIAVMLLKKLAHRLSMPQQKRIAVFLAPTVLLVMQQANVISLSTELKVGVYHGDQTDTWDCKTWSQEVSAREVMVMTPQIFYNALQLSALCMESVELIIFDECHHAHKNHPYASIMKTYYHSLAAEVRPKVFGMTASLVATRGAMDLEISSLESLLDSKIYTLANRTELEAKAPTPYHSTKYYSKTHHSFKSLRAGLDELLKKLQEQILFASCKFSDEKDARRRIFKSISTLYSGIDQCLSELGLWGANLAVDLYMKDNANFLSGERSASVATEVDPEQKVYKDRFLEDAFRIFKSHMPAEGYEISLNSPEDVKLAVTEGFLTPKLEALLVLLMRYRNTDNFRCIVFVERVMISVVLATLLRQFSCLNFLHTDYMIGVNADTSIGNSNMHQETLKHFRDGTVNVLISTSVAEEGLDVQLCNSVIRFNLCKTVRSFIQSRGRARKAGADYLWLLERGNLDEESLLMTMIKNEKAMRQEALSRMNKAVKKAPVVDHDLEVFQSSSGVRISTAGSVTFLYTYCSQLPGDKYYRPRPEFTITRCDSLDEQYKCTIAFPPNAPFRYLEGPARRNKDLAKKVACLEACKRLDVLGILLKQNIVCSAEDKMASRDLSGSGSTVLKELFPSVRSTTFQGTWLTSSAGAFLYVYSLKFQAEQDDVQGYVNFAFLIDTALDDDVGNFELNLYISRTKAVKTKLSYVKKCWLESTQLQAAKVFQEVMFNGAFSRLVFREDEKDRTSAKCLLTYEKYAKDLWSQMYLLLPMTSQDDIDWDALSTAVEAVKSFPHSSTVLRRDTAENRSTVSLEAGDSNVIHTAGGPVDITTFQDTVVLTVHTGKLFCVTEVLSNVNARSTFQEDATSEPCTYESFYIRKHGRLLQYQAEPFLRAKPTHAVHNHLINPNASKRRVAKEAPENLVELPAELCLVLGLRNTLIRSLYLVPSFMYRFTAYVIAGELRAKLTKHSPCAHASKILEALTSTRCQEGFSYEGLELLGDSVLKYAVSRKLFLVYADKHEGQLSGRRSQAICNATLRKLAVAQDLPAYIRDEPFYASLWLGAGMYRLRKRKCLCRMSNLVAPTSSQPRRTKHAFYIGKTCGEGHRWMCSKTTSDVAEALIGAYALGGGFAGALEFMKALKLDVDFDDGLMSSAQQCSPVPLEAVRQHLSTLNSLEKLLSYSFQNKGLLLQAITHASVPDSGFCYQRLEFLGDAALDLLVTQHFFQAHPGLSPGLLSDLRAAAVNNDCFARVAVKHGLHVYLRHDSGELQSEVSRFLSALKDHTAAEDPSFGFNSLSGPKVLGDLVESIVGAMLVDMSFDLDKLWTVVKPLLSPLVTPATLVFHPVRECLELCGLNYFDWHWNLSKPGVTVEICVEVGDETYTQSSQKKKREAKKEAAEKMLATLKELGHRHPRWNWAGTATSEPAGASITVSSPGAADEIMIQTVAASELNHHVTRADEPNACSTFQACGSASTTETAAPATSKEPSLPSAVEKPPRMILHDLCTQYKWLKPNFEENDEDGIAHRRWFSFRVSMEIPGIGCLEQVSCLMASKKRAMDDAAQKMVDQLKTLNIL